MSSKQSDTFNPVLVGTLCVGANLATWILGALTLDLGTFLIVMLLLASVSTWFLYSYDVESVRYHMADYPDMVMVFLLGFGTMVILFLIRGCQYYTRRE